SNLHLVPVINAARRAGARLVVIDPRRTKIAEQADRHLQLMPGTDLLLAWAMTKELERLGAFDHDFIRNHVHGFAAYLRSVRAIDGAAAARACGLDARAITELSEWYRDLEPAAISVGNGLERNHNGGSAIRAIFALPALAGKFGVPGGGLVNGASFAFPKTADRLQRPDLVPPGTRTFNIIDVGRHLTDATLAPPIKVVFIYNHNPLIVHPDQNRLRRGLERADLFIVGADVVMTDSMRYADIVLPACSHFEHADVYAAYGQHWLQRAEPVIDPVGEALPNTEIFRRLAARFGFTEDAFRATDEQLIDAALELRGGRASQLPVDRATPMPEGGAELVMFANVFPGTPSGKVELESQYLAQRFGQPLPVHRQRTAKFPLVLLSPASDQRITSTFGGVGAELPVLDMHPEDASARGLESGARVRAFNELGEVHFTLAVTDRVRAGVVSTPKGAWLSTSVNRQTVSALAPAHHADLCHGACFNDATVEVAPA
ncbi:MAG: molybdopterin-dependent oxidoreductase, partial [Planctomycetota bacterium]